MISRITPLQRFLLIWNAVNLFLLLLIIGHQSSLPEIVGRYTRLYLAGIGLALLLLIGLFSTHYVPQEEVSGDEPTLTDIGMTWLHTGNAYLRIVALKPVPITPGFGYWTVLLGEWMRVFGVTLASGRLFMWL